MLKSYHELVREYDFKFKGACPCNGNETHKYKGPNSLTLEVRKHGGTFRLYNNDKMLTNRWEILLHLEEKLKMYGVLAVLETKKLENKLDHSTRK